ncbi:MAG TPA: hypothetical protein VE243_10790 [Candidatus Acidoferrum sp.]|nr:hypothetical protein [Candidatus Acidoferrum sp.]
MAFTVPSGSPIHTDSIGQPNLGLVPRDRHLAIAQSSEQSARSAVIACLTNRSSGNSNLLRKAAAAAREHDSSHDYLGARFIRSW